MYGHKCSEALRAFLGHARRHASRCWKTDIRKPGYLGTRRNGPCEKIGTKTCASGPIASR